TGVRRRPAVAASRSEISGAFDAQSEVMVEDIETLGAVLGDNTGSSRVVDNVIADETVMAVMNRDAPLWGPIYSIADERELIATPRSDFGTEVVMEVDCISANLVRAEFGQSAAIVEFRVIQDTHFGPAHIAHFHIPQVYIRMVNEDHVTAGSFRILRP